MSAKIEISAEIRSEIERIGRMLYPTAALGPSISQWNTFRAMGFASSHALMDRYFGRGRRTSKQWSQLLAVCGREYPPKLEIAAAAQRLAERYMVQPVPKRKEQPNPTHYREGLPVIEKERSLRVWDPLTHRYRVTGTMTTYIVR